MSSIIVPGAGILFMKVGTHAQETLADIILRKRKEISDAGHALWGYGGNTCHPRTMVQPFAEELAEKGRPIYLCMQEMVSSHFAEPLRAKRSSPDGLTWSVIPPEINVRGSRYALVIKELREEEHDLHLATTRVAIGPSRGRKGSSYVQGRTDKACLEVVDLSEPPTKQLDSLVKINLVAELVQPYAVFLRDD